jgi:hypothetical protein
MKLNFVKMLGMAVLVAGFSAHAAGAAEGGELGNAFVPFASHIGRYSLEYDRDWHLNDLSSTTNFAQPQPAMSAAGSYFSVTVNPAGPASAAELLLYVSMQYPGVDLSGTTVSGLTGLSVNTDGVRRIFLQRAPRDLILIRFRSVDGERSDTVVSHMLNTFKVQ